MRSPSATSPAAMKRPVASIPSSWFVPTSGIRKKAVTKVPTMLPAVEMANSRPGGLPQARQRSRPQPDGDRRRRGQDHARHAEEDHGRDERVPARARIPLDHGLEHGLVHDRDQERQARTQRQDAEQQLRHGIAVREHASDPVPDRQPGEDDADQRTPDEDRAAEEGRQHAAGDELEPEQHRARQEHGRADPDCRALEAARAITPRPRAAGTSGGSSAARGSSGDESSAAPSSGPALGPAARARSWCRREARRPSRAGCGGSRHSTG